MKSVFKDQRFDFPWRTKEGYHNPANCTWCANTEEAAYVEDANHGAATAMWQIMELHKSRSVYTGSPKPALRQLSSDERKAAPVHAGVMLYFPDALLAVARVSKAGNDKHNPGEPLHWARGKSTDQGECIARHLLQPDAVDPDTGESHAAHAAWRALAALQLSEEKRLVSAGVMPLSGVSNG